MLRLSSVPFGTPSAIGTPHAEFAVDRRPQGRDQHIPHTTALKSIRFAPVDVQDDSQPQRLLPSGHAVAVLNRSAAELLEA